MSRVAVVLDTSALVGYAKRVRAVGLAIAWFTDEEDVDEDIIVGIPAAAYLAACWELSEDEHDMLRALVTGADRTVEILPMLGPDTDAAASLDIDLRRLGLGHAILETLRHGAALATLQADIASRALADDSIVDLSL